MKYNYSGNIESISSIVDEINNGRKFQLFPTNEITHANIKNNVFEISGLFCKGIGKINEQKGSLNIDLKVRLKRQFTFIGIFVIILLSGFIWGENVIINGDSDPTLWERIGFVLIGIFIFIVIPGFILMKLKKAFENKLKSLIK